MASCTILHKHRQVCAWENMPVSDEFGIKRQNVLAVMFSMYCFTYCYGVKFSLSISADTTGNHDFQWEFRSHFRFERTRIACSNSSILSVNFWMQFNRTLIGEKNVGSQYFPLDIFFCIAIFNHLLAEIYPVLDVFYGEERLNRLFVRYFPPFSFSNVTR